MIDSKTGYLTVAQLLQDQTLRIPEYQRPYKWTPRNVSQLFEDIHHFRNKNRYRLGTLVLHAEGGLNHIVDGQQRTLTLLLIVRAIATLRADRLEWPELKRQIQHLFENMIDPEFSSTETHTNLYTNWQEIRRTIQRPEFTEKDIDFLLNRCEFVVFRLQDISEAFQFFDSQNARGRDLAPHDLLKAYHLREFSPEENSAKGTVVTTWENSEPAKMADLFSRYLYRIRQWSRASSARYFGKEDVFLFKGVNMKEMAGYPYVEQLRIAHYYLDAHHNSYERLIDKHKLPFPFQIDQIVINGRRFFEMINHYYHMVSHLHSTKDRPDHFGNFKLNDRAQKILHAINTYEGRNRTGDGYVRSIFDCLLIHYIDKFGPQELSRALERIFVWAYTLRLVMQNVQLASMDNHVLEFNLFKELRDAVHPSDFFNSRLPTVERVKTDRSKVAPLISLFKEMSYDVPN